jgi:hypothetical protein
VVDEMSWPCKPTTWFDSNTRYISIPFTWNLPDVVRDVLQGDMFFGGTVVGGPAVRLMPDYFDGVRDVVVDTGDYAGVLQRVNPEATKTTTGCVNKCKFCAVPKTEGQLVELDDWPDLPLICDNNLFAASEQHFDKVCDKLEHHDWSDFNQGVDCRILNTHHSERLAGLRGCIVRLALDNSALTDRWERAVAMLTEHGFPKSRIRSYVLCGYESSPEDAWNRCRFVENRVSMALPMWYHPLDAMEYGKVLKCHEAFGWDKKAKDKIMHYYYQHRLEDKPHEQVRVLINP